MTASQDRPLTGRRVLVVEDQYLVAEEMRRMVVSLGGEVVGPVARCGPALELIRSETIDLALLDINLGPADAYLIAAELLKGKAPFLFVTGCEPWVVPEAFRDVPRLDKPLTQNLLAEAVRRLAPGR